MKKEGWMNIYPRNALPMYTKAVVFATKKEADAARQPNALACVKIEYEEGEGL